MPVQPRGRTLLAALRVVDDRFVSLSQRRFIMEPHREEQPKAPPPSAEQQRKRFRIVKLEDRIAPSRGGKSTNCNNTGFSVCACHSGAHCY
jgi:hypothetical protein